MSVLYIRDENGNFVPIKTIKGEDGSEVSKVEPADDDVPKVFFIGTAPTTKAEDELPLTMEYISKTKRIFSYVTLKVQGDSSAGYPKKNFNLKMFSDEARSEKLKMQFRNWQAKTHKYCLKANWIDHTHARNVVGGRLWNQIVKTRADYDSYPTEYRESSNSGAVDGFPIKVYLNGVYQGLYTWNIRKDDSMFNMDDSTGTHAALIADANNSVTVWRSLPAIDGSDWTDELNDTVPDAVKTGFRAVYSFVMNSTDDEFRANIGQYFYLSSLIDYYIYIYCILMIGGLAKSQTVFTYDAQKFLANIYDMDTTWALHWAGSSFYDVETPCPSGYTAETEVGASNLLYERLVALFPDEIKARYAELRNSVLSDANIINEFERFMDVVGTDLYAEDFASTTADGKFTEIPSMTTNTLQKLREIIVSRMAYCDEWIPIIDSDDDGTGDSGGDNAEQGNTMTWELGTIGHDGGDNENTARIRTVDYLPDNAVTVSAPTGYGILLVSYDKYGVVNPAGAYYTPATGTFGANGTYTSGDISVSDAATAAGTYNKFRAIVKRTDGADMNITEGGNITITLGESTGGDTGDDNTGGDSTNMVAWESGGLESTGVENTNSARIRTVDYLPDNITGLSVNSGYAYILVCANSSGETKDSNAGYYQPSKNVLSYNGEYSSAAISFADIADALGNYNKIRVLLKRTDGATMSAAEGENVIFTTEE